MSEQPNQKGFMKTANRISAIFIAISAAALGVMMFLSIGDITGRFFLHPIEGTSEMVGMLLVIASSLSLGWCQLVKGNIKIDIITGRLSKRWQSILDIFSYFMSVVVSIIIAWRGWIMTESYTTRGFAGTTATLHVIIWPFYAILTLGFVWVTIVFILDLYTSIKEVNKK